MASWVPLAFAACVWALGPRSALLLAIFRRSVSQFMPSPGEPLLRFRLLVAHSYCRRKLPGIMTQP